MGVDVKGTNCKLWIKEHEGKDGNKWNSYSISVSRKDMNGSYVTAYQDVTFTRNAGKDKEGKERNYPVITINKARFEYDPEASRESYNDSFEQLDEDVPF